MRFAGGQGGGAADIVGGAGPAGGVRKGAHGRAGPPGGRRAARPPGQRLRLQVRPFSIYIKDLKKVFYLQKLMFLSPARGAL